MNDLVSRLRRLAFHAKHLADTESLHALYREAFQRCEANETEAASEIERLHTELNGARLLYIGACSDLNLIKAERDEARRRVCAMLCAEHPTKLFPPNKYSTPEACAKFYGWDCFAGNTSEHM